MIAALDARRAVRIGIDTLTQRHRRDEPCDAVGWKVRTSCADPNGRVSCPLCGRRVAARTAGPGIVEIDHHDGGRS